MKKKNENFNINNYKIIQNTKLLLGHYFTNIFNINKENDLLYLGDEKVEGIIKDYNDELEINRLKKYYVFSLIKEN
jgi:thiamine biosynthesis protein ThiC